MNKSGGGYYERTASKHEVSVNESSQTPSQVMIRELNAEVSVKYGALKPIGFMRQ